MNYITFYVPIIFQKMSVRSSKLYLYSDDKTASANEVNLSYAGKPVKFSAPIQYQDGAVYHTLTTKFADLASSVSAEATRASSAETLLNGLIVAEANTARSAEAKLVI
jgi:hypothetical protein